MKNKKNESGANWDLNPGPATLKIVPKAAIIPLDHWPDRLVMLDTRLVAL